MGKNFLGGFAPELCLGVVQASERPPRSRRADSREDLSELSTSTIEDEKNLAGGWG